MLDGTKLLIYSLASFLCVLACNVPPAEKPCRPLVDLSWRRKHKLSPKEKEAIVYFVDEVLYKDKERHGGAIFQKYVAENTTRNRNKFPYVKDKPETKLHDLLQIDRFRHHGGKFISSLYRCVTPNVDNIPMMRVCFSYFIEDHVRYVKLDATDIMSLRNATHNYFTNHIDTTVFNATTKRAWFKIFDIFSLIIKSTHDIWLNPPKAHPDQCHQGRAEDYVSLDLPNPCMEKYGNWITQFKPTYGEIYKPEANFEKNATDK